MIAEIQSILKHDPAAKGLQFLLYPGLHALVVHKYIASILYVMNLHFLARLVSQISRFFTGIEIHPAAKIGRGVFIDHGMGVVIGETAQIGDECIIFHGVTLGGTGKTKGKRHPTVGNRVLIGAGVMLLGPITVGDNTQIGAGTVVVNAHIPKDVTIVGNPGRIVKEDGKRVDKKLEKFTL